MNTIALTETPVVHVSETTDGGAITLEIAQAPITARFGIGGESDFLAFTCHIVDTSGRWPGLIMLNANTETVEVSWSDNTGKRVVILAEPDKP